ncbi:hypothetical protein D3C86_1270110 [compost metagenome]
MLEQPRVQLAPVRLQRQQEVAEARRPAIADVLQRRAPVIAARIGRVVERAVRHERPVHELRARVRAVRVLVEHVDHAEVAGGQHHPALVHGAGELVEIRFEFFVPAAQAPGLADKGARAIELRAGAGRLGQLPVRQPAQAVQVRERHALRHFRVEVELGALPEPQAKVERARERVALGTLGGQAVLARIRGAEGRLALPDIGGLPVDGERAFGVGLGGRGGGRGRLGNGVLGERAGRGGQRRPGQAGAGHQSETRHREIRLGRMRHSGHPRLARSIAKRS